MTQVTEKNVMVATKIPKTLSDAFKYAAHLNEQTPAQLMRRLIRQHLEREQLIKPAS